MINRILVILLLGAVAMGQDVPAIPQPTATLKLVKARYSLENNGFDESIPCDPPLPKQGN